MKWVNAAAVPFLACVASLDLQTAWALSLGSPDVDGEDGVTRVVLQREGLATSSVALSRQRQGRHIYFDLGANWANTLRLYKDIADKHEAQAQPWEVYAFEASPLIVPYLERFVKWLNGKGTKPRLLWPPAGSSQHLAKYAGRYGCPGSVPEARECLWKLFSERLRKMVPDASLMAAGVVSSRLAEVRDPPRTGRTRYTLIPAAAGNASGKLHLGMVDPQQMIRGGALDNSPSGEQADVPLVDFVSMLTEHVNENDYVVIKMDIEGGEFAILESLIAKGKAHLVDVLALECHKEAGDCSKLLSRWSETASSKMMSEGSGYQGWDSESAPDKYYPEDPREGSPES